jgi:hypothetical protein
MTRASQPEIVSGKPAGLPCTSGTGTPGDDLMNPNPKPATDPAHKNPEAAGLPEEVLKISIDELVPFLNDFFAAMDAMRGPDSAPGDAALPDAPAA